ncbi:MAG: Asp-tRNA(Asn)/Glu-tRNA(Gln) amidotransferase subunit GatA [Candidatus Moranbacteria bacterium]|nr:Asp-tRNA(Asn)/Glu-tRNA(Gln) amidotransferase subunit GatA [Candidatus Moranbacteria bacterium]
MIKELHTKLVNGKITSVALTEEYFSRIESRDAEIGAYLTLMKESALVQARAVDEKIKNGEEIGMLEGIPCAIKDNICVEGVRATAGSKILDNYIAPYDATVIRRLKEAGAVIIGKTNMDEFAMGSSTENSAYQVTKNPVDITRVPGGSSGGSAAAVVADEAVFSLGTDTGGSIRQPAAFCGLVGLKPTYGRVSRYGAMAMGSSLDQIGPFGKTVEDVALVLSCIAGEDSMDATTAEGAHKPYESFLSGDIQGLRIGIPKEYFSEALDPRIKRVADEAIEKFKRLGAEIVSVSLPNSEYALPAYYIAMPAEVSSNLARFDGVKYGLRVNDNEDSIKKSNNLLETYLDTRRFGFGPEVKRRIMLGTYILSAGYYDAYYIKAQKVRSLLRHDFEKAFEQVDLIFSPTAPEVAFKIGEKTDDPLKMYLGDIYTITANLVGVPAISFPMGTLEEDGKNLPLGGHLMAKWFDEETLLCAADAFEKGFK